MRAMRIDLLDFEIARNEDWADVIGFGSEDEPLDLTGATFSMDVRKDDGTLALSLTTANGRLVVADALKGLMGPLVAVADVQSSLPVGIYTHDCLMVKDGRTRRVWTGSLRVVNGITGITP